MVLRHFEGSLPQMALEVAAGVDALLHDVEGVGIHLLHHLAQGVDLVLGQADAQHLHIVPRPAALGRPAGNAAAAAGRSSW